MTGIMSLPITLSMKIMNILRSAEVIPPITTEPEHPYLNSVTAGSKSLGQYWGEAICEAFSFIMHKIEPFIEYGLKISCLINVIVFLSTQDKKSCARAIKIFFIFMIYEIIIGAL